MTKDAHQRQITNERRRHVQMGPLKCIQGNQIGSTRTTNGVHGSYARMHTCIKLGY